MDPTSESGGSSVHPDLDRLAMFDEGLLDASAQDEVDRHLAGCATCPATLAQVRGVRESLGALPGPAMPPEVAERVHAALANEVAGAAPAAQVAARPARTVSPARRERRRSWLPTTAAIGSIAAVLAAIGYVVTNGTGSGGGSSGGNASSGAAAGSPQVAAPVISRTGTDYTIESLRAAVPVLLGERGPRAVKGDDTTPPGDTAFGQLRRLSSQQSLATCVGHLGENYRRLLAVDYARFAGKPAALLVFPDPGDAQRVEIFVAPPDCASNPNPISQIVFASR